MMIRRTISFILTGFLLLFLYIGSYHSFCECYAQSCPIHSHANPQTGFWILQTSAFTDLGRLHVTSSSSLFEEVIVYATGFITPLKARSPPHETSPQIIASRHQG
jgi:hypothetical protein